VIRPEFTEPETDHLLRALDQVVRAGGIDAAEVLGPIAGKLRAAFAAHQAAAAEVAQREAFARYQVEQTPPPFPPPQPMAERVTRDRAGQRRDSCRPVLPPADS